MTTTWKWEDILTWLRRYLRDPDGRIWAEAELLQYYNDAQMEISFKAGPIVRVETYNYPPEYKYSYTFDWEIDFGEGTQHQCLTINQADGYAICYPWEAAYWLDTNPTADDGYRDIHPWESCLSTPAESIEIPLHAKFSKMKMCAYDEKVIDPISEKELAEGDGYYRTRIGEPMHYWRPDKEENRIVLYPHPSPVWDETEGYEVVDDAGGLEGSEAWLDHADVGVTTDVISTADTLLAVYEANPTNLEDRNDIPDFAPYVVKYAMYATLERAYSADTDGFIPSLRDYWGMRKKIGIEALKKWKRMSRIKQDYRLGGGVERARSRHPRLPAHYPAVT